MKSRILILLSCFMLLAANVRANNLGVNVHTSWHSVQDIERHAEGLHAGYIRDTLNWSYVEKQKGEYHIDEREDYYKNMDDYGKTVIIILAFGTFFNIAFKFFIKKSMLFSLAILPTNNITKSSFFIFNSFFSDLIDNKSTFSL